MATSSVARPPNPPGGEEEPIPAMLDRARGLAASIGPASTSTATAGGSPLTATAEGTNRGDGPGQDAKGGEAERGVARLDSALAAAKSMSMSMAMARSSSRPAPQQHQHNRLTQTQGGRITKNRHRPSPATNNSSSSISSAGSSSNVLSLSGDTLYDNDSAGGVDTPSTTASATPVTSGSVAHHQQQHQQHQHHLRRNLHRRHDSLDAPAMPSIDPPVLSFWGPDPVPLPSRFARIKRNLIAGHEAALEASWTRLILALRAEVEHIEGLGAHLIPSIEFADVDDPAQSRRFGRDLRRYGVGVVRKVVPKPDADDMVSETVRYLESRNTNHKSNKSIRPPPQDPTCFDYFWTPAQVRSRAHASVLRAQRFMMGLWETTPDDRLATRLPITYVDRIRIHGAPTATPSAGLTLPSPAAPEPAPQEPQSADDWITALQSSAGIIAQVDNGSLERWEPDGYQRGGTYTPVFHGRWEDHDPWQCASRVPATMDLYNGYGACTIFRMFQGVLALSTIEPGMIRLLPSPKLATAYYLLRPFFTPQRPAPSVRSGPEWDAYLAPENWKLERDPDTIIHGAVPGHAQRITEHWHPHLHLRSSMITLPTLQPGDYILWHPDLPYHISSNNPGLKTPGNDTTSMLVYIPAAPLTQTNALYLARQRKAFQRGHPGPDFDSTGRGTVVEDPDVRPGEKVIAEVGGPAGLQAMGLAPWEVSATRAGTPPPGELLNERSLSGSSSSSTSSGAEAEVVRLSNIILFPDRSMMGYSV